LFDQTSKRISPFVVGVTGHRDLHPDFLQHLRGAVAGFLKELRTHLADSEVRVMAGMASGADLLVAETALELGLPVDAVLPMPLAHYAADFDPDSFASLKKLLAHPEVSCVELPLRIAPGEAVTAPDGVSSRDAHYAALTRALTRGCNLLIAIWDGESSALPGGTADTVLRYLRVRTDRNKEDTRLQFLDLSPEHDLPARLVYWIPAIRAKTESAPVGSDPCYLAGLSDNALLRLPAMPRRLEVQLYSLNAYNIEYQRFTKGWRSRGTPDSLMKGLALDAVDSGERAVLERIDAQYGKADALALFFQKRSDQLFAFYNLVAVAMALAYLAYEKLFKSRVLLFTYLFILISSAGLYLVSHKRHWFAKHLMCRVLAETLRVQFYLRLASGDRLVDAEEVLSLSGVDRFHGFGWIGHVLIPLELPAGHTEAISDPQAQDGVALAWIESQHRYFVRKVARLHRHGVRTKWAKRTLFGIFIGMVLILLALGNVADTRFIFGLPLDRALTLVMGLSAVMLASWELHQNKMATRELLWQYRNQLKHFGRARSQLARTFAPSRRLEILGELGKDSLMESYLWTIHRFHREHEPPGRA
jgi:hypothetical protein